MKIQSYHAQIGIFFAASLVLFIVISVIYELTPNENMTAVLLLVGLYIPIYCRVAYEKGVMIFPGPAVPDAEKDKMPFLFWFAQFLYLAFALAIWISLINEYF